MTHMDTTITTQTKPQARSFNAPAILTKQQAAEMLGCTERYLERQIRFGRLRACKPSGKFVRIYMRDIDAFLQSGASIS